MMSDIVLSVPIGIPGTSQSVAKIWNSCLPLSSSIRMTTGYITSDAITELKRIAELNSKFHFELFIGMHYFERFTKTQYDAVSELSSFLKCSQRGKIYLSPKAKYHGKMYSFGNGGKIFAAAIGSSNLGSFIGTSNDLLEADCCFQNCAECRKIDERISHIISDYGTPFEDLVITEFNENNDILEGEYGVERIETAKVSEFAQSKIGTPYDLPLKTEAKSNLNAYFGKGRVTPRGMVQPRPWYEVEIIVPSRVTAQTDYPKDQEFQVCTDDGWSFACKISGDYGKNFRSAKDLKILGKWIKGRMERAGALKIGSPITEETLDRFGKHTIRLTRTKIDDYWMLEMI